MTTCGLCRDCVHWGGEHLHWDAEKMDLKECARTMNLFEALTWGEGEKPHQTEKALKNKAFVQDGSNYWALLYTRADFGCVQFEGKDDEKSINNQSGKRTI